MYLSHFFLKLNVTKNKLQKNIERGGAGMGEIKFNEKIKKCKSIKEIFKQILQKNDVTLNEFETISDWIKTEFKEEATFKKEA